MAEKTDVSEWDDEFYDDGSSAEESPLFEVSYSALQEHRRLYGKVEEQLEKARIRLAGGCFDEAVFHASRTFDEYFKTLFVNSVRAEAMRPFISELRSDSKKISLDSIFNRQRSINEQSLDFICIGLAVTLGDTSNELIAALCDFIPKNKDKVTWDLRNRTLHTTEDPTRADTEAFVGAVASLLSRVGKLLEEQRQRDNVWLAKSSKP